MKNVVVGLMWVMFSTVLCGQVSDDKAPLNEEYLDFLDHPELYRKGYIPHPFKLFFNDVKTKSAVLYDDFFDLRNVDGKSLLTPVRNQGSYGTCWAFAALASVESYWLSSVNESVHLSVRNMANCHGFEWGPDYGGNSMLAASYLTRLSGPVLEPADPYSNIGLEGCTEISKEYDIPAYVGRYVVSGGESMTKYMLVKYGAVATSMCTDHFYDYFDASNNSFFYQGVSNVDHGVTIVGWNDTITVRKSAAGRPSSSGAWIVKNSWGLSFGDEGYFYVSYEDKYVGKQVTLYPERLERNEVDTLYYYDKLGAVGSHGFPKAEDRNVGYALVKYNAPYAQIINRVGTYVNTGGTTLDFVVARGWDGTELFDTLAYVENEVCRFPGYHSVELNALTDSGEFYVMTRYYTPGNSYPIPVEEKEVTFAVPQIEPIGKQWVSADGVEWDDFGMASQKDLCVRAYAKKHQGVTSVFAVDKHIYCLGTEVSFENQSLGAADSFIWLVKDSILLDTLISYSKKESLTYNFVTGGFKSITLIAVSQEGNDTLFRSNYIEIIEFPEVYLSLNGGRNIVARGKEVTISAYGAEDYIWSAKDDLTGTIGSVITFTPSEVEQWVKVKGFMGSCVAEDSLLIETVEVLHDDISQAKALDVNVRYGPFSNRFATVEQDEPAPPEGDCDTQTTWCVEGGLHNSIWFKFVAPVSEEVSITTSGFDNQIALYSANKTGGWEDILSGNPDDYTLLAANDDGNAADFSGVIGRLDNLEAGKTYWIQADGSAGGDEGDMYIEVVASLPTLDKFPIHVQPNPFIESLNIDLRGLNQEEAHVRIYSMQGQCVFDKKITEYQYQIDKNDLSPGHYVIEVVAGEEVYRTKFSHIK